MKVTQVAVGDQHSLESLAAEDRAHDLARGEVLEVPTRAPQLLDIDELESLEKAEVDLRRQRQQVERRPGFGGDAECRGRR